jgi:formate dehydrogenase beta subunit
VLDEKTLQIRAISAHPGGAVPGKGAQRELEVCKLMDTTTCIGCKACEVACVEWNDMPFRETHFDNTYQTMPETDWNFWQLIKFAEVKRNDDGSLSPFASRDDHGQLMWIFRKDQCMHCADPGCMHACPADGAIVQYENGIVDFQQENCIGCQLCISGCPFNIPKFNQTTKKVYKCTLCSDRVGQGLEPACIKACPTGCLQFGSKVEMKEIAENRAKQLRDQSGFSKAGVWDPSSVDGTHVIYVLHDATQPEMYGNLPARPTIPLAYTAWKFFLKPIGLAAAALGAIALAFHYVTYGPKRTQPEPPRKEESHGNR